MTTLPRNCDRARAWASLQLDDELSELESAMLASHLERCAACRAFATGARGLTLVLRTAPLEPLERPVTLPAGRRPITRAVQLGAAAALVAASVGLGSLFGALGESGGAPSLPKQLQRRQAAPGPLPLAFYDQPRGLPQFPLADYLPRKGLTVTQADI